MIESGVAAMILPAVTSHANFPADMHGSPGGHAQPRHAQMCGVRVQAWPDTCKDFPAAWNLCHEFAWSHVARKFSRSIRSGWGVARIFLLNEICARISLQRSGYQVPSTARARISLQGSGCQVPSPERGGVRARRWPRARRCPSTRGALLGFSC